MWNKSNNAVKLLQHKRHERHSPPGLSETTKFTPATKSPHAVAQHTEQWEQRENRCCKSGHSRNPQRWFWFTQRWISSIYPRAQSHQFVLWDKCWFCVALHTHSQDHPVVCLARLLLLFCNITLLNLAVKKPDGGGMCLHVDSVARLIHNCLIFFPEHQLQSISESTLISSLVSCIF